MAIPRMMRRRQRRLPGIASLLLASLLGGGCALIYHQPVQQGSVLEQEDIDQLQPGMTKRQVSLVIGTPAVVSPFRQDRWDYVYSFRNSDDEVELKNFTVYFERGALARTEGDFQPGGSGENAADGAAEEAIRDVQTDD